MKSKKTKSRRAVRIFYIGEQFYYDSATMMGSYYEVGTYKRFDPHGIAKVVNRGRKVLIKSASKREMAWAHKNLASIIDGALTKRKELVSNV